MSRKILAGNWKMNLNWDEAKTLASTLEGRSANFPSNVKVIIAPSAPYLSGLVPMCKNIHLAAQNVSDQAKGAFTGEWSATMLKSLGVDHCLVGHSERRSIYGESDVVIAAKVKILLENNIVPIFCFGEQLEDRDADKHFDIVKAQLKAGVLGLDETSFSKVILAYEPVWAIGTGRTATSAQAQEMHSFVRNLVSKNYSGAIADKTSILYGGSCNPSNGDELFACKDVDGGLIGGASLKADDFISLINQNGNV